LLVEQGCLVREIAAEQFIAAVARNGDFVIFADLCESASRATAEESASGSSA